MEENKNYSRKDFTGKTLLDKNDITGLIVGSCFSQEIPDTLVFPKEMTGVVFIGCNLDNVMIPEGNIVSDHCTTRRYKSQNDGQDWLIDEQNNPIEPLNKQYLESIGGNTDPNKIPTS